MSRKRVIFAVALVIVSGLALVGAYELAVAAAHRTQTALHPGASLTFLQQVDLGTLEEGKEVEASFAIKNQSSGPVRLSGFTTDCGCMGLFRQAPSGPAPLGPTLLSAGEELVVSARFAAPVGAPADGNGGFTHRVTFTSDPPAPEPRPSVLLTGTVQVPMSTVPDGVNFGLLRPHQAAEKVVHLVDRRQPSGRTPFTLVSDNDSATVESVEQVKPPEELARAAADGQVYRVKLKVQAGGEGDVSGRVLVRCGDEKTPIHTIPFAASVRSAVRLVPSSLVFPRPGIADAFSAPVRLRSDSPCEFAPGPAPKGFQLEQDGKSLVVRCDPAESGPGKHTLAINAKAADGATHRLTLKVFVAAPPPDQP
jgi:uncharacterized protein DUF1573